METIIDLGQSKFSTMKNGADELSKLETLANDIKDVKPDKKKDKPTKTRIMNDYWYMNQLAYRIIFQTVIYMILLMGSFVLSIEVNKLYFSGMGVIISVCSYRIIYDIRHLKRLQNIYGLN